MERANYFNLIKDKTKISFIIFLNKLRRQIMKKVKIGLLGFGTVAGGTFDILKKNAELISKRSGCEIEVAKVFARIQRKLCQRAFLQR